jgi:FkbM family methyltransferase
MSNTRLPLRVRIFRHLLLSMRPASLAVLGKRLLRIRRLVVNSEIGPLFVDPISNFGDIIIRNGRYEPHMTENLKRFLGPDKVFVDVGANEGFFTVMASKLVGPRGTVMAVEPQVRLRPILEENLRLNGIDNVLLRWVAVSDNDGEAELQISPDTNTGSSGLANMYRYRVPLQTTKTISLSRLLADSEIRWVDLLKMDIEGFEYEAVFGSANLFRSGQIQAIALELHPGPIRARGLDPGMIPAFLENCGYRDDSFSSHSVSAENQQFRLFIKDGSVDPPHDA